MKIIDPFKLDLHKVVRGVTYFALAVVGYAWFGGPKVAWGEIYQFDLDRPFCQLLQAQVIERIPAEKRPRGVDRYSLGCYYPLDDDEAAATACRILDYAKLELLVDFKEVGVHQKLIGQAGEHLSRAAVLGFVPESSETSDTGQGELFMRTDLVFGGGGECHFELPQ